MSLDWPPVSSDHQVPQEPHSSETGKLCIESCSGVSTLVAVSIATLIGQSNDKPNY